METTKNIQDITNENVILYTFTQDKKVSIRKHVELEDILVYKINKKGVNEITNHNGNFFKGTVKKIKIETRYDDVYKKFFSKQFIKKSLTDEIYLVVDSKFGNILDVIDIKGIERIQFSRKGVEKFCEEFGYKTEYKEYENISIFIKCLKDIEYDKFVIYNYNNLSTTLDKKSFENIKDYSAIELKLIFESIESNIQNILVDDGSFRKIIKETLNNDEEYEKRVKEKIKLIGNEIVDKIIVNNVLLTLSEAKIITEATFYTDTGYE